MTTDPPSRYPLAWPAHRPRKIGRISGQFRADERPITVAVAINRLQAEVDRLGGKLPILSSNLEVRIDGSVILNRGMPLDPGAVIYFQLKGKPYTLACDTFTEISQNIAALAAHIEATRRIERYGVATASEALHAFQALPPPPGPAGPAVRPWRVVLGLADAFPFGMPRAAALAALEASFKLSAQSLHPDRGGTAAAMAELNEARERGRKEIEG